MAILELSQFRYNPYNSKRRAEKSPSSASTRVSKPDGGSNSEHKEKTSDSCYPVGHKARTEYQKTSGKRITPYQWRVYDHVSSVPAGKVTTYKNVALAVGGSARSAGTALGNNPFAPLVPCHRVIASNLSIGGFCGQRYEAGQAHPLIDRKRALLLSEGVRFDGNGYLCHKNNLLESKPGSTCT
ncbi:DNA binding methylated-DNA--cysteine S-methyltransferase [Coprinopsis marcescibilis]|uniref:Methylated-DNA--protein-cysteine methyltransferase n=1 Tax=Coprinopsis marcescibilis TaxID=230819 RepID=A0A5C3KV45_COPMA|nr:DNA binding methylated-DNA--cysteine S-methyltransferase [Coprinopsis marcescibilis]